MIDWFGFVACADSGFCGRFTGKLVDIKVTDCRCREFGRFKIEKEKEREKRYWIVS